VSVEDRVRRHFDLDATRFDAIYDEDKGLAARFIDHVWRGVVRRRFQLTLDRLRPLDGARVLDVGCGSGRYCIAYAARGASRVVGIDFSPEMVRLARAHARRAGVADRCEFQVATFPESGPAGPFEAATAMGYFDYVADPVPSLRRMREITAGTIVLSFPKSREWRVPIRRLRFNLAGCPLYLYSRERVERLLADAGIRNFEIVVMDRDYVVVART
jgi:2-polyprenyl-3-methyl-5-hydroxy-6-metoxy-1,4-benzoquinol methylase